MRMKFLAFVFAILSLVLGERCVTTPTPHSHGHKERDCPCTASQLWLDIVLVLDVSASMTSEGLAFAEGALAGVFGELTVAQTFVQTSRVAIVTFASNATVYADLSLYNSVDELMTGLLSVPWQNDKNVNLLAGLQAAETVIQSANAPANRKSVVIVFTSAYESGGYGDPKPIADQLKENGHTLITVAYMQPGVDGSEVSQIGQLASPGRAFLSNDTNFQSDIIQAFCQVNCFCRDNWRQYSSNFKNESALRFGECLRFASVDTNWYAASLVCQKMAPGAFLANEYSAGKHKFNNDYARSVWNKGGTPQYFVGLEYDTSLDEYAWQQPSGQPVSPLVPGDYTAWGVGYPNNSDRKNCVKVAQKGFSAYWENINCFTISERYICQVDTCDTDNYCENIN